MKNPHRVEPTRYMKRKGSKYAIGCDYDDGPRFGNDDISDIYIGDYCNEEYHCSIHNNGTKGYECHPKYKSSLFVNTAGPEEKNHFSVFDYENRDNINKLYKHPDIIWEYIQTKDISEKALKHFDDNTELLNDMDAIHCYDKEIRLKISRFFLKDSSDYLPKTLIQSSH